MLETLGALGAAIIAVDVGSAELILGLVVAVGFLGCVTQGRDQPEAR